MSNSIVPDSGDRGERAEASISSRSSRFEKSLSEQLLAELSPHVALNEAVPANIHVNEFTTGEILGNESLNKLPPLKGKEAPFIPLHLAKDYVRKVIHI